MASKNVRGVRLRCILGRLALAGLALGAVAMSGQGAMAGAIHALPAPRCSSAQPSMAAQSLPPASVTTVEQAYTCLLDHYPTGPTIDDRILLRGAMVEMVAELVQRGVDQSNAVLPALGGDHGADWRAFRRAYSAIAARLPRDARTLQGLAQAAIAGMVGSLHDDHTRYAPPLGGKGGGAPPGAAGPGDFGPGLRLSADPALPERTTSPVFVVAIDAGSPAARAGLRPGDILTAIDGLPLFVGGLADQVALAQIDGPGTARLIVRRPGSNRTRSVAVTPAPYPSSQPVTARILPGGVAYVRLTSFVDNAANYVFAAVDGLGLGSHLRGLVLDMRGNGGGSADEPARLLGAFAPHRIFAYVEDGRGHRTPSWTVSSMPPLRVPLAVLIDRGCASACDVTAAAVHDLRLGRLIGERTAGDAAGPANPWFLDDGGALEIPVAFMRGAVGEIVDGIGVPPDEEAPASPAALAVGRDPALAHALHDLGGA